MKITEAIILAGGLGTRLRSAVPDLPKCMAPVKGIPFISYVIDYFHRQGIEKFIFSLGYRHEVITSYLDQQYPSLNKQYSIEQGLLGTGGGVKLSCSYASEKTVLILNGDTLFKILLDSFASFHYSHDAYCTLSLKPMKDIDRYGTVELNSDSTIKHFTEKQFYPQGLINGGVYALQTERFLKEELPEKFSFEKDFLEAAFVKPGGPASSMYGVVQDEYFVDIGTPVDYERAQHELTIAK
jgi:D-glycero-alpha-D-manno-heptose 1-phosphate guanylyltransferase